LTEAHHIDWWDRDLGPTNLSNGVLLCCYNHHLLHRAQWVIRVRDGRVWFIPPPHIDPQQRPRPGNTLRRALPRADTHTLAA
jgi:5-methylcytosine-specific restriction protein A